MKKLKLLYWAILLSPGILFAATPPPALSLGAAQSATTEVGSMIGTFMFIAVVAIWLLPLGFGVMVYSGQKKKAEQQHDEVGMKAALYSLVAIIIGTAMAYYVVGNMGKMALGGGVTHTIRDGNSYFLKTLFDVGKVGIDTTYTP